MNAGNEISITLATQGIETIKLLAESNFSILLFGALGFAIVSIIKLIVNRKDKVELINNGLDIFKYIILFLALASCNF